MVRILICDERPLISNALQEMLAVEPDFDIVGIADSGAPDSDPPLADQVTSREREVLVLAARGLSTAEIAAELFIAVATVRTHLYRVQTKLGLRDRAALASFAYRAGLMRES